MKTQFIFLSVLLLGGFSLSGEESREPESGSTYSEVRERAERHYAEKSYQLANSIYAKAKALELSADEAFWVEYRLADTQWRSFASTRNADPTPLIEVREVLMQLLAEVEEKEGTPPGLWADISESLGDSWWFPRQARNWHQAWQFYEKSLAWWAGSRDIEEARERYLKLVWKTSGPPEMAPHYYYGSYGNYIPLPVLENAIKISVSPEDQAHAHYLMAMALRGRGGSTQHVVRVGEEFEAAVKWGRKTEWYDDAMYHFAQWASQYGHSYFDENGELNLKPDYEKALTLHRRLLWAYEKGDTRHYDSARNAIQQITRPTISLTVSNAFLPGSEAQFHLEWRNVEKVRITLYRVDLSRDIRFSKSETDPWQWLEAVTLEAKEPWKVLTQRQEPERPYYNLSEDVRLDDELSPGAYLVEARGGGRRARDILLVSDSVLVLKTTNSHVLGYFAESANGAPIPEASVTLWERYYNGRHWVWNRHSGSTDGRGLVEFSFKKMKDNRQYFAAAVEGEREAYALSSSNFVYGYGEQPWRVYAYTDRPAYRPNETVNWKIIMRQTIGDSYRLPADEEVFYRISSPRGEMVDEGQLKLNAFGSAWGNLELSSEMALGAYSITFLESRNGRYIGQAVLFRLEEYKLPEFKVAINLGSGAEETGEVFRIGDTISGTIKAEYYFGGAVSEAAVEIVVYQRPFFHWYRPMPEFHWLYEDLYPPPYRGHRGKGAVVKRESLRTDSGGRAVFSFSTPRHSEGDYEYTIEGRVVDASRREIVAASTIRVTRQGYFVYLEPEHKLYKPGDRVEISVKTLDANNRPVSVEGRLRLTREEWRERWIDQRGREISDKQMGELRRKSGRRFSFGASAADYHLKEKGYSAEEIETTRVRTEKNGEGFYSFEIPREGFFKIAWISQDTNGQPIRTDTAVWAAEEGNIDIGYRPGGVSIVVDKDTFRVGERAPVMISIPSSGRYVLFSSGAEEMLTHEIVRLEGTVKLLYLEIGEEHVPNSYLDAVMVSGNELFFEQQQIVVPPTKNFLNIEVTANEEGYEPQQEGHYTVRVSNNLGAPLRAEISFALVDEAVFAIQPDLAPDIREFFFGRKRPYSIRTNSTFSQKPYFRFDSDREGEDFGPVPAPAVPSEEAMSFEGRAEIEEFSDSVVMEGRGYRQKQAVSRLTQAGALFEGEGVSEPAVVVRTDFRSTVFWRPDIVTGADGRAEVKVSFPDSLTSWKATVRGVALSNRFGAGDSVVQTRLPLIARLQAPRFFVTGDRLLVSGIFNNNTGSTVLVRPSLEIVDGLEIEGTIGDNGELIGGIPETVLISPEGEARVDWQVFAKSQGNARIKLSGIGAEFADAMEKTYPVYEHGIRKLIGVSGKIREDSIKLVLELSAERKVESTKLEIAVTPSAAVTMLDALPYLLEYPYGCTEQTMSRFLPAVIVAKTLEDLGLEPEAVAERMFGGVERGFAGITQSSKGRGMKDLNAVVESGLKRLYDFQHSSGGWGWWKKGADDHFMTAYVVWGLTLAEQAGIGVNGSVLMRARSFLEKELVEAEQNYDLQVWMLHALSVGQIEARGKHPARFEAAAFLNLMKNRERLTAYTRALLALAAHNYGQEEDALLLIDNLRNGVKIDKRPDRSVLIATKKGDNPAVIPTAHWEEDGIFWRWSEGGVEATAFALMALLAIDPNNQLVEPVANWLIKNRRGAQWSNTRDTAITVLALNHYLLSRGEMDAALEYELLINGERIATTEVTPSNILDVPSVFEIDQSAIRDGENLIEIRRLTGEGSIYFAAQAEFFSLEEPIPAQGNKIFVEREYYRIQPVPTLLDGYVEEKRLLKDGDQLASGDRIEVVLTIEGKNNYEYLVLEDLKPAGFESVQLRSGEPLYAHELKASEALIPKTSDGDRAAMADEGDRRTGRQRWVYQELRDRQVACFVDRLPEGFWEIRYRMRAETPGRFHALPVMASAMYVPEIRANSSEVRLEVSGEGPFGSERNNLLSALSGMTVPLSTMKDWNN